MSMRLGIMVPLTGPLNNLGPDMRDAALLAAEQINNAKLGVTITTLVEDDKTVDTAAAPATFQRLVGQGAHAIVGPCCSGITASILEPAVRQQVIVASMSATSPGLTLDRDNNGYFWRIATSDAVQGKAIAQLVRGSGVFSVSMVVVDNPYGNGLAKVFDEAFKEFGGTVANVARYPEGALDISRVVRAICASSADGIVFVSYVDDGASVIRGMQSQGCLSRFKLFASEAMYIGEGNEGLPAMAGRDSAGNWLATGIKGTNPATVDSEATAAFKNAFKAKYARDPTAYSAEAYDAVHLLALGALRAKSTNGVDIRNLLDDVANSGASKTKTYHFPTAVRILENGGSLDWVGAAHDFDFDVRNEPGSGVYSYWEVNVWGETKTVETGRFA